MTTYVKDSKYFFCISRAVRALWMKKNTYKTELKLELERRWNEYYLQDLKKENVIKEFKWIIEHSVPHLIGAFFSIFWVGKNAWFSTRSADLFYLSNQHYIDAKNSKDAPKSIEIPYWKCGKTLIEDILMKCRLKMKDYYAQQPFANREQLACLLDSNLHFYQKSPHARHCHPLQPNKNGTHLYI